MNRMRLRSSAALYNGNIKGPKQSMKPGSDEAGWNSVRAGLDVLKGSESLKARFRLVMSGRSPGRNRRLEGESKGESGAEDSVPPIRYASQYLSRGCMSDMSSACFLSAVSILVFLVRVGKSLTAINLSNLGHGASFCPVCQCLEGQALQSRTSSHCARLRRPGG